MVTNWLRHAHFKAATRQFLKLDTGVFERSVNSSFCLMPRPHGRLFEPINGTLRDLGSPAEFGLAPAQHRSRRPHPCSKQQKIGLDVPACAWRSWSIFHRNVSKRYNEVISRFRKSPAGATAGDRQLMPRSGDQGRKSLCMRTVNSQFDWFDAVRRAGVDQGNGGRELAARQR